MKSSFCIDLQRFMLIPTKFPLSPKTDKNTASVFRVFDLLYIQIKLYESKLSTALSECKAVARCATRKTDTAINRIKTVGACKTGNTTRKTNIATNRI